MERFDGNADVVVVGGGPGGCVAALLLAARGRRVTVLEQDPSPGSAGAGIMLQPNGLAVLDAMGLSDALHACGAELRSARLYDERGQVLVDMPIPDFGPGLDHALALRRQHLAAVLDHALRAEQLIEVRGGARALSADGDGLVTYGTEGETHRLQASLVVGADGVGSQVRRTGRFRSRPIRSGHRYARVVVDAPPEMAAGECWSRLGLFGLAPLADGTTYVYASVGDPSLHAALAARDLNAFVAEWTAVLPFASPLLQRLEATDELQVNEVGEVRCGTYVDGRTVLIGDAAHAMAPNLGQGANSALVDAAVLVAELTRHDDQAAALRAYAAKRRPAVRKVQRDAERLSRLGHLRGPVARGLRDRAVTTLSRPALMDRQLRATQQIDPSELRHLVRRLRG